MSLQKNTIHVWSADLQISDELLQRQQKILSVDEQVLADKFKFPIHRKRYIAARSILRQLVGEYLNCQPQEIKFSYSEKKKPYLANANLQFNVSHSKDLAVFAFTLDDPIGIDVEYMDPVVDFDIAKRFFSKPENHLLQSLDADLRVEYFYRIWARKEALIKATGKGFTMSISSFSVNPDREKEEITVKKQCWEVQSLQIHKDFQGAIATHPPIKEIRFFQWHS